jgi:hypothetical protein
MVLLACPSITVAQAPSPQLDPLAASLLTIDDLPGFTGRDLEDPAELDIDRVAFDAHRGMGSLTRAWVSQEQGVVFDQRMLFPTAQVALGYLAAAEPTLSEADDAGLALVTTDPLTPATRHWAGEATIGSAPVAMDVWLVPVGPVVAKVSATLFGSGLDLRRTMAERALARLESAYGPVSAVWPSGSPGPSPVGSSGSDLELFQRLVQAVLRTGARGCDGDIPASLPGEVVAMTCTDGDVVVVYRAFTDAAVRDAAYGSLLEEVPEPTGSAASCRDGAYRGAVTEAGRTWSVACWESSSGLVLLWTEPDEPVLGAILAPPFSDLVALWQAARFVD